MSALSSGSPEAVPIGWPRSPKEDEDRSAISHEYKAPKPHPVPIHV